MGWKGVGGGSAAKKTREKLPTLPPPPPLLLLLLQDGDWEEGLVLQVLYMGVRFCV